MVLCAYVCLKWCVCKGGKIWAKGWSALSLPQLQTLLYPSASSFYWKGNFNCKPMGIVPPLPIKEEVNSIHISSCDWNYRMVGQQCMLKLSFSPFSHSFSPFCTPHLNSHTNVCACKCTHTKRTMLTS